MRNESAMATVCGVAAGLVVCNTIAGPDKVAHPKDYLKGTLYATVDRIDIKQYRDFYASPGVVESVRAGRGIPDGAVLTMVQWSVEQDAQGNPIKGVGGRFVKKDVLAHFVMAKRRGWGAEYPPDLRNGEWEYATFLPNGDPNPKIGTKVCFECHRPYGNLDFVITHASLAGKHPDASAISRAPRGDVNIVNFAFMPAKVTAAVGKPLKFLNADHAVHDIVVQGTAQRTDVLLGGQTGTLSFDKAGVYTYICGLHPSMKGTIEVK